MNGQKSEALSQQKDFAQLGKDKEEWMQMQLNENHYNDRLLAELLHEHQEENAGVAKKGNTNKNRFD